MYLKFSLYLAFLSLFHFSKVYSQCQIPTPTGLEVPKPVLPDVFQTRIEINTDSKKSTMRRLFYDYKNRKAAIIDQSGNIETRYIFDYQTNEIHILFTYTNETTGSVIEGEPTSYSPIVCDSFSLTDTPKLNYLFGYSYNSQNVLVPGSVYQALNFKEPIYFKERDKIRGIPCDVYFSCQYIPEIKANFTATYYFSEQNYSMPLLNQDFQRLPVRAIFEGTRLDDNNNVVNFKETYDYYEFRANRTFSQVFQTPPGIVCLKRKKTLPTPDITSQFKFSEETTQDGVTSYIKDLYYNQDYQAVRYERRNYRKEPGTFYSTDPLITIHDYNIGVSFTINKNRRNCSITPIPVLAFDSDRNYTNSLFNADGSLVIRLKSPTSFLLLDSDYVYTGQRKVNNVPSNIFVSDRSKLSNQTLITEYAFATDEFSFQENYKKDKNIPVSLWIKENDDISYTSFYDYDTSDQVYEAFDVSECFPKTGEFDFNVKFPYKDQVTADKLREERSIVYTFSILLTALTNESFTRFSKPRLTVSEDGNLYIRSSILPNPPPIALFTAIPGFWIISPTISFINNITTPEECAAYCVRNIKCLSFDFGLVSKSCYLNPRHNVNGTLSQMNNYVHYSRNTLNGFDSRDSSELWNVFKNTVESNKFVLPIRTTPDGLPDVYLVAEKVEIVKNNKNRYGTTGLLSKYNVKNGKKFSSNQDRTFLKLSIDDCAKACNEELGFECKSFDFCYINGDCRLSRKQSNEDKDFIYSTECDVYEKDPLYHYNEYPTKSYVNKKDIQYSSINSPSECASKCDNELKIHCRSFNYCPELNSCFLSEKHLIDTSAIIESQDLVCSHYSRDYLSDFTYTSSANITLESDLVFEGSTVEQCSLLCVVSDGFNCKSFNYCPITKKCLLNKGLAPKPNQNIGSLNKDVCRNYKREYFYATSSKENTKTIEKNNSSVVIGVSLCFGFIGIITGFVGMYLFLKKKNKL